MIIGRRVISPTVLACVGLILFTIACGKKADAPDTAGETGMPAIESAPGDIIPESAAVSDTTPGVPVAPTTAPTTGKPSAVNVPKGGAVIGYDSAFGPSYELDSAGRAIPMKRRKP
ncbi:MAG: hypothetical protein RLZZ63_837 [Gemmatimonadota bacterium]|jgi:hypothetical protein